MKNKGWIIAQGHQWDVSTTRAREIQQELRAHWVGEDRLPTLRTVAGLDAAFVLVGSQAMKRPRNRWNVLRETNRAIGCVVMYRYPEMVEIERAFAVRRLTFPYVPGLLSFREIPVLLAALKKLTRMPDLFFCDGQGYAHPRRLGLASHLGVVLDRPSIGCAKRLLIGTHLAVDEKVGSWTELIDERAGGERIGAVVRTRDKVKPIFVSQGNRLTLETAIKLTLRVADGFRIPRPTRDADHFASATKRRLLREELSEK